MTTNEIDEQECENNEANFTWIWLCFCILFMCLMLFATNSWRWDNYNAVIMQDFEACIYGEPNLCMKFEKGTQVYVDSCFLLEHGSVIIQRIKVTGGITRGNAVIKLTEGLHVNKDYLAGSFCEHNENK